MFYEQEDFAMGVKTFEGIVNETGNVQLLEAIKLPTATKVYVVVPMYENIQLKEQPVVYSPRLANPFQRSDFVMEVIEETPNAEI
ncbi:MAG: hypothetical protein GY803_05500 [Chloroflexi bacterium]|nr:hypothetical protein [Chloroflexota bacterium]